MIHLKNKVLIYLPLIFRVGIGALFIWSGYEKLAHPDMFTQAVLAYKVLPEFLALFYAFVLPWLEVLSGVYLILGLFIRFTAGLTGVLLLSFMIAIAMVLYRGDTPDCGCFIGGVKSSPVTPSLILRDLGLLGMVVYIYLSKFSERYSLDKFFKLP